MIWLPLVITVIATAEVKGTPEPCGCNADPLGDVARIAALAKGGLWLDAGSLLYNPEELGGERTYEADAKAGALASIYAKANAEVGLGASDLSRGRERVKTARQACNVTGVPTLPPRLRVVDGVKLGIFGVVSPERVAVAGVTASDPALAATAAVAALKKEGAALIIALAGMSRVETRRLLRAVPGIDLAIVGAEVGEGMAEPEAVGPSFLMAPADQGRRAVRLTLATAADAAGPLQLYVGEAGRKRQLEAAAEKIARLTQQLAEWKKDASADPAFLAARQKELAGLVAERRRIAALPPPAPPTGRWFSHTLEPVRLTLPRDAAIAAEMASLARTIGKHNLAEARRLPPLAAEAGQPSYVGSHTCGSCHKPAVAFWQKTAHSHAWKTLVDVDKQYHYECIGCHVTGWQRPGGVHLGNAEKRRLTNVQCEVCHGPASVHVKEAGLEEPASLVRRPANDFCVGKCHTKEHSDTFDLVPYLRDILGDGHGSKAREELGDGVTGHELRQRALGAAGR